MYRYAFATLTLCAALAGCGSGKAKDEAPRPRPVTVMTLKVTNPQRYDRLSATVATWKTENIGFEVDGRVNYVIEPDTDIEPLVRSTKNVKLTEPTLLASIDKTKYLLRVESAKAKVSTSKSQKEAVAIEVKSVVPAEIRAANADVERATLDFQRYEAAYKKNAATKQEYDLALANREKALAQVAQLQAKLESKKAEAKSLDALILQDQQALKEAEKNVADCEIVSPFRGRVSEVHVIPGGNASRGEKVLTVQMMDPIKVQLEVSADTDRRIDYQDILPVFVTGADGKRKQLNGVVYQKSTTADAATRTYMVTLMVMNEIVKAEVPDSPKGQPILTTKSLWSLQFPAPNRPGYFAMDAKGLHRDDEGYFVWKVTNRTLKTPGIDSGPILKVKKLRVTPADLRASLLGLVTLVPIKVNDESQFNRGTDLLVGGLDQKEAAKTFAGDTVLLDRSKWLLRPGDVVTVDVSGTQQQSGFYIPINALRRQDGKDCVFVVQEESGGAVAKMIEVRKSDSTATLVRIEAAGETPLTSDMKLIVEGVHYINDGEPVAVSATMEVRR